MKTRTLLSVLTMLCLLGTQTLPAQENQFEWVKRMGGTSEDKGQSVAMDAFGNVYTTGYFKGTASFGAGAASLLSAGNNDIFVQKLDPDGNLLWVKQMGGSGDDRGYSIVVDDSGNVFTTGGFGGTVDFNPGEGIFSLTSAGGFDVFIQKLDTDGNFLWVKQMGGTGEDRGQSIVLDDSGNIYTAGVFNTTVDFDPGPGGAHLTSKGDYDIFVQKLDPGGNFIWVKQMGGTAMDWVTSIAVDADANVYMTGFFEGAADFDPGEGTYYLAPVSQRDIFVQKLDAAGDFLWAKRMGGAFHNSGRSIAVDDAGSVYTTGLFYGSADFDPGEGTFNLTSAGNYDSFVQKLDTDGNFLWAKRMGGGGDDRGYSLALDASANIYTTGWFSGTADFDPGPGTANLISAGSFDVYIQKLDSAGNFIWAERIGGSSQDESQSIAVDSFGNVYTTGSFKGTADFDIGQGTANLTSAGNYDGFVHKIHQCKTVDPTPDIVDLPDLTAMCEITASDVSAPTATDDCGWDITGTTATIFPITTQGTTIITWTYDDGNGNTTTQTQDVVITDVTAPVPDVTDLPDLTSTCEITALDAPAPTATDDCVGAIIATTSTSFPITVQGTIIWTYDDGNDNTSTQTQNVVITDETAPIPDVTDLPDLTAECEITAVDAPGPTATNNCAAAITGTTTTIFPITAQGTTTITWTYDDGNGNTSTQTQNVIITDVTAPVADVTDLPILTAACEIAALDAPAPTATDNCAGIVTGSTTTTFPITAQGTTTITWTYDDGNGNTSTQTQNVVIIDDTAPEPDEANLPDLTAMCEITALDAPAPTAGDNCTSGIIASPDQSFPITDQSITEIVWTYDDGNGNVTTQSQTINWTPVDVTTSLAGLTITSNNNNGTYQWVDCDNNNAPISGENNQSFTASANGNYAVEITESGCVATSECVSIISVGLSDFEKNVKLTVYPNPSSDVFNIKFEKPIEKAVLTVTDIQGKLISTTQIHNASKTSIELNETSGIYLLTIKSKEGQKTIQLVKE